MDIRTDMNENNYQAIGLTWGISKNRRRQFKKVVEQILLPKLTTLHDSKKVVAMLPFRHKPLNGYKNDDHTFWTDYWVIVIAPHVDIDEIWQEINNSVRTVPNKISDELLRAEILHPQPHMDMYYPRIGGIKQEPVWHAIEYVMSQPKTRAEYYQDQYTFSEPVIRHFWEANVIKRMIGFESERFLENKGGLPKWDVIHITGFRPLQLGKIGWHLLRFLPTFNSYAKKIGYKSAMEILHSWDAKRIKYLTLAKQDHQYTLHFRSY